MPLFQSYQSISLGKPWANRGQTWANAPNTWANASLVRRSNTHKKKPLSFLPGQCPLTTKSNSDHHHLTAMTRSLPYPANTRTSTNLLRFYSELRCQEFTSDDLPLLNSSDLNALDNEALSILASLETQLEQSSNDEHWVYKASLKQRKTKAFRSAISNERCRRGSAIKHAKARRDQGKATTRAECQMNALRRLLKDHMDPDVAGRLFATAKAQGNAQYNQLQNAVDELELADGYFD